MGSPAGAAAPAAGDISATRIGFEDGAAERADDGAPGAAVHGHVTEPSGRLHVRHAGGAAATGADTRRGLCAPHLPPLVHQEAEERHYYPVSPERLPRQVRKKRKRERGERLSWVVLAGHGYCEEKLGKEKGSQEERDWEKMQF